MFSLQPIYYKQQYLKTTTKPSRIDLLNAFGHFTNITLNFDNLKCDFLFNACNLYNLIAKICA
jgi:hypothetical protein